MTPAEHNPWSNRVKSYFNNMTAPRAAKGAPLFTAQMRLEVLRALNQRDLPQINKTVLNTIDEAFADKLDNENISSSVQTYHDRCEQYRYGCTVEAAVTNTPLGHISKELFADPLYLDNQTCFTGIGSKNHKDMTLRDFINTVDLIYKRFLKLNN